MAQLLSVYRYEGYGWYWRLIEMMRVQEGYKIAVEGEYFYHGLAETLRTDVQRALKFVTDCIEGFKLFESDGEYFWSNSLIKRMKKMEANRKQCSKAGKASAGKRNKNNDISTGVQRAFNGRSTPVEQRKEKKGKEKKRKESKVKKGGVGESETSGEQQSGQAMTPGTDEQNVKRATTLMDRFKVFYKAYPRKKSPGTAEKAWITLNPDEQLLTAILAGLERAKTSESWTKDNGEYVPYPATWLRAKGWKDEHIPAKSRGGKHSKPSVDWNNQKPGVVKDF